MGNWFARNWILVAAVYAAIVSTTLLFYPTAEPADATRVCVAHTMCDAQTTPGPCSDPVEVKAVADMTFYSTQSVGNYECAVMSGDYAEIEFGSRISHNYLNPETSIISFRAGLFYYVWIDCPEIETSVTVTALVCSTPAPGRIMEVNNAG